MIKQLISNFLTRGHERTLKAKKNIIALFFIRGYSVLINLALIPLTLDILGSYKYGVWITIFNVLSWIQIFDIGIGNGLRNKFTEAIARNDIKSAKEFVSTAYVIMGIISLVLIVLFFVPWYFINWTKVFNTNAEFDTELRFLIGIAFALTAIQFSVKLINTILTADQKPALSGLVMAASNTIILIIFLLLKSELNESLVGVGLIYTTVPIIVFIVASFYFFNSSYKNVKPVISSFKWNKVQDLFSLGSRFFIIQIAGLVIFQTDALIISHVLSPEEVTPYNIVFRYFGIVTMLAGIIMTPFWSAYSDAKAKGDYSWIKNALWKQVKGFLFIILIVIILAFSAPVLIDLWIKQDIPISRWLIVGMAIYTLISVWNNIFAFFLNGISRTKVQIYTSIIGLSINIPLSIYLAKIYGSGGVIMATCISLSFFAIFGAIESFNFLKQSTKNE